MPAHTLLCTFSGYCMIRVFLVPLPKRCTGEGTIGKIISSIEVRKYDIMVLNEIFVVSYETLTAIFVQVVKIRSSYGLE